MSNYKQEQISIRGQKATIYMSGRGYVELTGHGHECITVHMTEQEAIDGEHDTIKFADAIIRCREEAIKQARTVWLNR